jgi:hypothetical protein
MSDIAILKEMINKTATVSLVNHQNKKKVVLEEKDDKVPSDKKANYTVEVLGLPEDSDVIVIKVDAFKSPISIFNEKNGICKRSDFVIVADTGTEKVIVIIEMKAGNPERQGIIKQFKGAQYFVRYCQEIGKSFWNQADFLEDYSYRFVAILNICKGRKTSTAYKERDVLNDTPDNMFKVPNCPIIQFKKLI